MCYKREEHIIFLASDSFTSEESNLYVWEEAT